MTGSPGDPVAPGHPPLARDRWTTLELIIDAALDLPPEQRGPFLDKACAGDRTLREQVARLLEAADRRNTVLDEPASARFPSLLQEGPSSALPSMLGNRYLIEGEIGRGGMATVYLAHDTRHERKVAVKVLAPELAAVVGAERFLAEIRTTAQLHHPHILPLYDSGEADGFLFYVMPYVEGESLRQRMSREHQLPVDDAVRIASEVASALDAAHRQGVIHRDIKPENILLLNGSALVADFGIALAVRAGAAPRLTNPGLTVGTPQYMSPEQASGERAVDVRSDIYSLGTVLYEMLAGEPPFTGATTTAVVAKLIALTAPSVRIVRTAIPKTVDAVVSRALAREPVDRFRTASDFADALQLSLAPGAVPEPAQPEGVARGKRRRFGLPLMGMAVIVLALAGAAVMQRSRSRETRGERVGTNDAAKSIAVLPLTTIGSDTGDRFFAESMTDELSSALGKVPGLRVVPGRSAAFLFAGKDPDFKDLGLKLGVATLLQGRARQEGSQRKVTIELVSARDGGVIWNQSYSRNVHVTEDVYAVRDDIVKEIVGKLQITLAGAPVVKPPHRSTEDLEAYDLYYRGVYFINIGTPVATMKALRYFQQAIARDSNFANAYVGLSYAYSWIGASDFGDYPPNEIFPKARAAAQRALVLDGASGGAYALLAGVEMLYDFDWSGAEQDIGRAMELDKHSSDVHLWHGVLLYFTGRFDQAIAEARLAVQDTPLNMRANIELGRTLLFAKRYSEAIVQLSQTLERDSTQYRAHLLLGEVLEQLSKPDSAVVEMQKALQFAPTSSRARAYLAHSYARAGRTGDALRELGALQRRARSGSYVPAFDFAVAYVGLGKNDETFLWLAKAADDHSIRPYLMDPSFDAIRFDPRYQQLLRKMHHPLATKSG